MAYVYILRCDDDTLYTGITNDIEKRIKNHLGKNCASHAKYMRSRKPIELLALWQTQEYKVAAKLEYAIKKRLSRIQKFQLAEKPHTVAEIFPHLAEFEFVCVEKRIYCLNKYVPRFLERKLGKELYFGTTLFWGRIGFLISRVVFHFAVISRTAK